MGSKPKDPAKAISGNGNVSKGARLRRFFETDIWEFGVGEEPSARGQWMAFLRILSIAWKGLGENRLFSRAAALSYSSLLALGPLVAVSSPRPVMRAARKYVSLSG